MLTLEEIEPSTPVGPLTTPGDADAVFVINQGGAYHLTQDVVGEAGKHGIQILTSDVTLDLRGFSLIGGGVAGDLNGIHAGDGFAVFSLELKNGRVWGWDGDGVNFVGAVRSRVENISSLINGGDGIIATGRGIVTSCYSEGNGGKGIEVGFHGLVADCIVNGSGEIGIQLSGVSIVQNCAVSGSGQIGINASQGGVLVRDCTSNGNLSAGISLLADSTVQSCVALNNTGQGIRVSTRCIVDACTAAGNRFSNVLVTGPGCFVTNSSGTNSTQRHGIEVGGAGRARISNCVASDNTLDGIVSFTGCTIVDCEIRDNDGVGITSGSDLRVERCTVVGNAIDGIAVSAGASIVGNYIAQNGLMNFGAGAEIGPGNGSHIIGNLFASNDAGLRVNSTRNFIAKNHFYNNNTPHSVAANNSHGPFLNVLLAGDLSGVAGAEHPQANFEY